MMYDDSGYIGYMAWRQTAYGKYTQRYHLFFCFVLSFVRFDLLFF